MVYIVTTILQRVKLRKLEKLKICKLDMMWKEQTLIYQYKSTRTGKGDGSCSTVVSNEMKG
jgi:hypothetical protein